MELIDREKLIEDLNEIIDNGERSTGEEVGMMMSIDIANQQPTVNTWISVEDELPEVGKLVVVQAYFTNYKGEKRPVTRLCTMSRRKNFYDHIYDEPIRHPVAWMPIPEFS